MELKCIFNNNEVKFKCNETKYQNIITFFDLCNISFLSTLKLNFINIPIQLHGKGTSENILDYLANNTNDIKLITKFLTYFIIEISNVKYINNKRIKFKFINNDNWQDLNFVIYTETTTTTTLTPNRLRLTWDNILNVPVDNVNSVNDWNTFFDLPNNGNPFTSVIVSGNDVNLIGGSNITIKNNLFPVGEWTPNTTLISVIDNNSVVEIQDYVFLLCVNLIEVSLPSCTTISEPTQQWYGPFSVCTKLNIINLPLLTNLIHHTFYNTAISSIPSLPSYDWIVIPDSCFGGCINLENVELLNTTSIGNGVFSYCEKLTNVNIPNLITLGNNSFEQIPVEEFNFPLLETIGQFCFAWCNSAITFYMPLLTNIPDNAFYRCTAATTLYFPLVTTIQNQAFTDCQSVQEFNFPNLIEIFNFENFENCTAATTFYFPLLTTMAGQQAFSNCTSATTFYMPNCTTLGACAYDYGFFCYITGNNITLTISSNLMTCNDGNPNASIRYLIYSNDVTIIN